MSSLIDKEKQKINKLEEILINIDVSANRSTEMVEQELTKAKSKLKILELNDPSIELINEMKIINTHAKAVYEKYDFKTVQGLYKVAELFDKSYITKPVAVKIRKYIMDNINAPVCSIFSTKKQELGEMPKHTSYQDRQDRQVLKEIKKFMDTVDQYNITKVSFIDKIKHKLKFN